MANRDPFPTPDSKSLRPIVTEALTPWSEVRLEDFATHENNDIDAYRDLVHIAVKNRARSWTKAIWLAVCLIAGIAWLLTGGRHMMFKFSKNVVVLDDRVETGGLRFIDATHPYIRYVGRWMTTADGGHKYGSFPGVYFDFAINGSATVLLSLHNRLQNSQTMIKQSKEQSSTIPFLSSSKTTSAPPVSLLAGIDDGEYIVLPNATSLVTIRKGSFDRSTRHDVRIIAPMVGDNATGTIQVEGLWIEEGAVLLPSGRDELARKSSSQAGSRPLSSSLVQGKVLEIMTDMPGSMAGRSRQLGIETARDFLSGVMGWEYLLGEMFGADQINIGMDRMCLISNCIGGRGSPVGLADVFFRSGPVGSEQYAHTWLFQDYIPDVMIMNIGNSDWDSFQSRYQEYNKTIWELSVMFEETYISMIKAIRTLAYPKYSNTAEDAIHYADTARNAAANIPIFVMRPFRGQLEQTTHSVVDRLRRDGDQAIYWLDTSGWLNTDVIFDGQEDNQDFFLDGESSSKDWRLTERGNQRVAILLHMHVCRYLARDADKCAFLPPEIHLGKALDHNAINLDGFPHHQREQKPEKKIRA